MEIILSAMHITRDGYGRINIGKGFALLVQLEIISKEGVISFIFIFQNITEGWWSRRYTLIIRKWKYTRRPDYTKEFIGEDIESSKKNGISTRRNII